jgi:glucose/arabinose dehydrogenase
MHTERWLLTSLLLASGCGERPFDPARDGSLPEGCVNDPIPGLSAEPIPGSPFVAPIYVTQAPGRPDALFVVEQGGTIRIVVGETVSTFLTVTVNAGGEMGLLGLAFDPEYETSGRFFVYYTSYDGGATLQNIIGEYHRSDADPNVADPAEVARIVQIDDPEGNHNGGCLQFGRDGRLYAGTGDGGGGGDQHGTIGNALDLTSSHGKILRFDIDAPDRAYAADGNPFSENALVWAYGLRNPWRWSFDRETGDMFLGDVGQSAVEEIDFLAAGTSGANFGWRAYEGTTVFDTETVSLVTEHTEPILELVRAADPILRTPCAIIGGYVYRGAAIPALRGTYLFGDGCSPDIGAFHYCASDGFVGELTRVAGLEGRGSALSSFGEGLDGELYMTYSVSGDVLRIIAAAP